MGMKPRVRIRKRVAEPEPQVSAQPRQPINVAALGGTPEGWSFIHETLHQLEEEWQSLTPLGRDAFMKAMALFLGSACAESAEKQFALMAAQALVRQGFVDYRTQRNNICQAVTHAHIFQHGDQTVN